MITNSNSYYYNNIITNNIINYNLRINIRVELENIKNYLNIFNYMSFY